MANIERTWVPHPCTENQQLRNWRNLDRFADAIDTGFTNVEGDVATNATNIATNTTNIATNTTNIGARLVPDFAGVHWPGLPANSGDDFTWGVNLNDEVSTSDKDNNKLVVGATGEYEVKFSVSLVGGTGGSDVQLVVEKDGAPLGTTEWPVDTIAEGKKGTVTWDYSTSLTADDDLTIYMTWNTKPTSVEQGYFRIRRIG